MLIELSHFQVEQVTLGNANDKSMLSYMLSKSTSLLFQLNLHSLFDGLRLDTKFLKCATI